MKTSPALVVLALLLGLWSSAIGCRDSTSTVVEKPQVSVVESSDPNRNGPADSAAEPGEPPAAQSATQPASEPIEPKKIGGTVEKAAGRPLPPVAEQAENDEGKETSTEEERPGWEPDGPSAEEVAGKAFLPPPGAKLLSKTGRLWIDRKLDRVYVDGYVAMKRGPLEMFACPVGTKEHESIVATLAKSREVHAALLAIDASPGTPVRFRPEFVPPTGQVIRVWVCWYDSNDQFQSVDAREWIEDLETEKAMTAEWVFSGSGFWQDPEDKREYYQADSGDMICVSNFSSAMMDVAISSSADADSLRFVPMESKIPDRGTPVRLVLVPVPLPTDNPKPDGNANLRKVPTDTDVPRTP
jgi:hypothetical protein